MNTPEDDKRQKRIAIVLAVLFAGVMTAFGIWSIVNGYHSGQTKKGATVILEGDPARWAGLLQICVGMFILVIAMPNWAVAKKWITFWVIMFAISLVMVIKG